MAKFKINLHGEEIEIEAIQQGQSLHIGRDGATAECEIIQQDGAAFVIEQRLLDGTRRRIRAAGFLKGDQRQLWVNGRTFTYERVRQRGSGAAVGGSLASSIPAIVAQVLVTVGAKVTAGEKLILLESMKMVIPIQAPQDGVVKAIHCAPGDSIEAGVPLLEIDENP